MSKKKKIKTSFWIEIYIFLYFIYVFAMMFISCITIVILLESILKSPESCKLGYTGKRVSISIKIISVFMVTTFIRLFVCLFVCLFIHSFIHSFIRSFVCFCLFVCLFI